MTRDPSIGKKTGNIFREKVVSNKNKFQSQTWPRVADLQRSIGHHFYLVDRQLRLCQRTWRWLRAREGRCQNRTEFRLHSSDGRWLSSLWYMSGHHLTGVIKQNMFVIKDMWNIHLYYKAYNFHIIIKMAVKFGHMSFHRTFVHKSVQFIILFLKIKKRTLNVYSSILGINLVRACLLMFIIRIKFGEFRINKSKNNDGLKKCLNMFIWR